MTLGPLIVAAGLLLLLRIDAGRLLRRRRAARRVVFGLGLPLTVAPLTATVLAAAAEQHAGVACGVNNAVARTAGLLAVAALPVMAGLAGADYSPGRVRGRASRPSCGSPPGRWWRAGLLAAATIRNDVLAADVAAARDRAVPPARHCAVDGPPLTARHISVR